MSACSLDTCCRKALLSMASREGSWWMRHGWYRRVSFVRQADGVGQEGGRGGEGA